VCDFDAGKLEKAPRLKATSTLVKKIDAEVLVLSSNTSGTILTTRKKSHPGVIH